MVFMRRVTLAERGKLGLAFGKRPIPIRDRHSEGGGIISKY
jgi:hypothetical protein